MVVVTIETEPASVRGGNAANIVVVGTTINIQSVLDDAPMARAEEAAYLKCHPKTLYNWAVRDGRIPYSQPGDRGGLRFMKEDLDGFLGACRVGDTSSLSAT